MVGGNTGNQGIERNPRWWFQGRIQGKQGERRAGEVDRVHMIYNHKSFYPSILRFSNERSSIEEK